MSEPKNRIPHDFMKWHDIRIDEYKTAKVKEKSEEQIKMIERFSAVAKKYIGLQFSGKGNYIVVIPKNPFDLVNEGNVLHHCVGSMNYDQKFIREDSLIFFVREKDNPQTPYVTLEYSPKNKLLLQCHGENNNKPNEETMDFINKKWLPYARKQLKQIA